MTARVVQDVIKHLKREKRSANFKTRSKTNVQNSRSAVSRHVLVKKTNISPSPQLSTDFPLSCSQLVRLQRKWSSIKSRNSANILNKQGKYFFIDLGRPKQASCLYCHDYRRSSERRPLFHSRKLFSPEHVLMNEGLWLLIFLTYIFEYDVLLYSIRD